MSALIVGAVTVAVARDGIRERVRTQTEYTAMFDESMRALIRPRKRVWEVTTAALVEADRAALYGELTSTALPVACSGDALRGAVSCLPELLGATPVRLRGTLCWVVAFTLHEA